MAGDWLRDAIGDGLEGLIALGLKGQPAAEIIPLTADIWLRAVRREVICTIETIDAPRIREGFDRLFPGLVEWPAPKMLIERIPARPARATLDLPPASDEQWAAGLQKLREIKASLAAGMALPAEAKDDQKTRAVRNQAHQIKWGR